VPAAAYDEAYCDDGKPRAQYADLLRRLVDPGALAADVKNRLRARGVNFGGAADGIFALDPVPRIFTAEEWAELQTGVAQRVRTLDAFVADVYGDRRAVAAGVVPRAAVEGSPHYEPAMRGAPMSRWVTFAGLDVVRCPDGRFRVIEDQVRMPSGLAYAVAARETLRGVLPVDPPGSDLTVAYDELAQGLRDAAPPGIDEPRVVLLCEGPSAVAWWEHERLSRELCAPTVTLDDLELRDGRVVAWIDGRPRGVDVIYQRTEEDRFGGTPLELLLGPCREGKLGVVNAPGAGVADDKLVHAHFDDLVRFFLEQEPLLASVPSRPAAELDDLAGWVVKPRGEMGGEDVVLWDHADEETRRRTLAAVRKAPDGFIAQEQVTLSVAPTVCDGRLEPRHVDFRPFAVLSDQGVRLLPGGVSRVALVEGSMVVNSGQGGGAKDTWVLEQEPF
jgi:uncharacterized circularly permuted ATP-grasp superfamily protein